MTRNSYLIGNWKMNKTAREAADFIETLLPLVQGCEVNLFLAVPFTTLTTASQAAKNTPLVIGAQNLHEAREGAFTGEIASLMLKEAGASFVLIGHSERRTLFGETDETIRKKIARALADDLIPVLCIGETAKEREAGKTDQVFKKQLGHALEGLPKEEGKKILIAYEPVWAIGTGKSATPEMAHEAHAQIRTELSHLLGKGAANQMPILYGGSVTPENASSFMAQSEIDGLLVGGASLDPKSFAAIAKQSTKKKA